MDAFKYKSPGPEALYGKYADMLFRLSLASLRSKADAEDAVQDVFIKYIDSTPRFESAEHEKAWFVRATVNKCHDIGRRKKVREYVPLEDAPEDAFAVEAFHSNDVLYQVYKLPEKYRTVMLLYYFEENGISEVAKMLGISVSAVKMRLLRGKEQLSKILGRDGD